METISQLLKALSEPIRLRIMALLLESERCVCDLTAALELPQSTISRHLSYLRNSGWVEGERRGAWMYYRLTPLKSDFKSGLKLLLSENLSVTSQGKIDKEKLTSYLEKKDKNACK